METAVLALSVCVYALIHPITREVRYIGITTDRKGRLRNHRGNSKANKKMNPAKHEWVQNLKEQGLKPDMVVIEEFPAARMNGCLFYDNTLVNERERYWINHYSKNERLLNIQHNPNPPSFDMNFIVEDEIDENSTLETPKISIQEKLIFKVRNYFSRTLFNLGCVLPC